MSVSLIVMGAAGRMGSILARLISEAPDLTLAAVLERPGHEDKLNAWEAGGTRVETDPAVAMTALPGAVVVDFTAPEATMSTARLAAVIHGDERIAEAEAALQKAAEKARKLADRLRKAREKAAPAFAGHIRGTLARLGMPDTVFEAAIDDLGELTRTGGDSVRFLFSANRGRAPQSVERIASGGELSRVMLALKALLAERMQLPTIIFDEIDTGVSGRIADAMGEIIASLAASMQVVDITHLPQVASKGAAHFVVYKRDGRTSITRLSDDERITEIAKMLSGSEITDAAIAQARILLGRNGEPHPAAPGCSDTPAPGSLF